jgi:hypothetical protein
MDPHSPSCYSLNVGLGPTHEQAKESEPEKQKVCAHWATPKGTESYVAFILPKCPRPCPPTYYLVGLYLVPGPWIMCPSCVRPSQPRPRELFLYACQKYARRIPRLLSEHSPAFSVVNPCIVVLAMTGRDRSTDCS